ncbi:P-loop containing nucleoside triphosphate hydrolase protein [Xylogone sp. PMI_703]|nr:P-loop containing nucleoside triphosphate hydrolase protein [Xylogone sp. PMI_703]
MEEPEITSDASPSRGLSWHHVILNDVSGFANKGSLTGIIGPSGSGKTTLLNVLTGRVAGGKSTLNGKILFEGKKRSSAAWKWTVGYVEQFDLMYDSLTCYETLAFNAVTRLPSSYSTAQKLEHARGVMQTLGLEGVRETKVGSEVKRGLSGGERKRVAVGCELVTSPQLLCLDECTSGLDSHSAFSVISTLQQISRLNVAVLCTIHQPSFEIFSRFDRVILMALGRIAFHGTIPDAVAHFEKLGYPLPAGANAADHFIALLTEPGNKEAASDEEREKVRRFLNVWREIQEGRPAEECKAPGSDRGIDSAERERRGFGLGYTQELYWLTKRAWVQQVRSPANFIAGIAQSMFMSIVLGFTFFRLGFSQGDVLARAGLLFFIPIQNTFGVLFPLITFVPMNTGLLMKERRAGAYRVSTYYLSRYSVEIPVNIVSRLPFFILIYWMCNFKPETGPFFIFVAINCATILLAITMGLFISSLSTRLPIVQLATPALNIVFVLFAGFLLPLPSIPKWFIWIHWMSYATYVFAALTINELKGLQFDCPPGITSGCYGNGQEFLDTYDLETVCTVFLIYLVPLSLPLALPGFVAMQFTIAENMGLLFAIVATFALLGYIKLRHLTRPNLTLDLRPV